MNMQIYFRIYLDEHVFFLWENEKMGNKLKIYLKDKKLKVFLPLLPPAPSRLF